MAIISSTHGGLNNTDDLKLSMESIRLVLTVLTIGRTQESDGLSVYHGRSEGHMVRVVSLAFLNLLELHMVDNQLTSRGLNHHLYNTSSTSSTQPNQICNS